MPRQFLSRLGMHATGGEVVPQGVEIDDTARIIPIHDTCLSQVCFKHIDNMIALGHPEDGCSWNQTCHKIVSVLQPTADEGGQVSGVDDQATHYHQNNQGPTREPDHQVLSLCEVSKRNRYNNLENALGCEYVEELQNILCQEFKSIRWSNYWLCNHRHWRAWCVDASGSIAKMICDKQEVGDQINQR